MKSNENVTLWSGILKLMGAMLRTTTGVHSTAEAGARAASLTVFRFELSRTESALLAGDAGVESCGVLICTARERGWA